MERELGEGTAPHGTGRELVEGTARHSMGRELGKGTDGTRRAGEGRATACRLGEHGRQETDGGKARLALGNDSPLSREMSAQ